MCEAYLLFDHEYAQKQTLERLLFANGAIYAARIRDWREQASFFTDDTVPYRMPPERSLEIDDPWQLDLVRAFMER